MTSPLNFLDQFPLPAQAREDLARQGIVAKTINQGQGASVTSFELAGYDKGVAFRFYIHDEENKIKSEAADMLMTDPIEMIEWTKDKKNRIVERVRFLPPQLLKFNKLGECVGGLYKEAYLRWKAGLGNQGLPFERWNEASSGEIKTLNSEGFWTVHQLASAPADRIEGRFPKRFVELYRKAIAFVNREAPMEHIKETTDEIVQLKQTNAQLQRSLEDAFAKLEALSERVNGTAKTSEKRGRGRPKKATAEQHADIEAMLDEIEEDE